MNTENTKSVLGFIRVHPCASVANSVFVFGRRAGGGDRQRGGEVWVGAVRKLMGHGWTRMDTDKTPKRHCLICVYLCSSVANGVPPCFETEED